MTLRAVEVLKQSDVIAAEDTRNTAHLLNHYGIATPLLALHEHNEVRAAQKLIELLTQGKSIALVSDAGTPAISDPGAKAVAAVRNAGFTVVPIPGASAVTTALSAAGMEAPHYLFYGFLPAAARARRKALDELKDATPALVFYEAPHRVLASIADMTQAFGAERTIVIARELTKLFETIHVCALGEAEVWLNADANRAKGEFVIVISGAAPASFDNASLQRTLEILLNELPLKQAVKLATELTGARRNDVYDLALKLKKED